MKVLISYWYFRNADLDAVIPQKFTEPYPTFFADSGAFSAMTQGGTVDLHAYATWLRRYKHWFGVYANLDVIRRADQTWCNQTVLEDTYELTPLPVFHVAEDWAWYDRYLQRYSYIALGVAGHRAPQYMGWLVRCFREAGYASSDTRRAALHGFGVTDWEAMRAFPWYSVDSSTWNAGPRFGAVPVFQNGDLRQTRPDHPHLWYRYAALIRSYGFDPATFVQRDDQDRDAMTALALLAFNDATAWCRKMHGPVHVPGDPGAEPGMHLYFADSSLKSIATAYHRVTEMGITA